MSTLIQSSTYALELLLVPALFLELRIGKGAPARHTTNISQTATSFPALQSRGQVLLALGSVLQCITRGHWFENCSTLFSPERLQVGTNSANIMQHLYSLYLRSALIGTT